MHARLSSSAALVIVISAHPAHAQAAAGQPLNAKVQEALMGPVTQRVVMSDDGDHLAIVTPKGSREIVIIDGVEGPVFDEIPANYSWGNYRQRGGPIVFSPTGGRSAYVGRRAGDFIAVVDGKEAVTLSTPETVKGHSYTDLTSWAFVFNKDGSRLAYGAQSGPGTWVMVVDGVKSPPYRAFDFNQLAMNGKRVVYVAQTADMKWHAVVDGKVGQAYDTISSLKVTSDGAHYAFIGTKRSPTALSQWAVIDGVEGAVEREITELEQAPDGRVAYMTMRPQTTSGGNPPHLIVGALDAPWTTTFGYPVPAGAAPQYHVAWSADGKRFAYIQQNHPNPGVTVMVNGKPMGQSYNAASGLMWSPDGSRLWYVGHTPNGAFPVIDGEELAGFNLVKEFQWSPDGKRYAFYGTNATGTVMIVDGKEQPKALGMSPDALRFSPDGKHIAYGAQTTGAGYQPVVDLVLKPHSLGNFHVKNQNTNPRITIPVFFYSPDGNHLAYVGVKPDGSGKTVVWVDGVAQQGPMPSYFHPSWSPDSKHFAAVISNGSGQGWTIMLDGKLSPAYEDILVLNAASAGFADGRTYRFYAIKAGQIYRVTLAL
ncbi:MAG TPA: hypothetical protein VH762_04885 [Gemmatimonadaceae bacterium]